MSIRLSGASGAPRACSHDGPGPRGPLMAVSSVLACSGLTVEIAGRRLVEDLGFELKAGEFLAVLGQNGAGKTLTLHTLAGLRRAQAGDILIKDRRLEMWPRRALAQTLGLVAQ